MQDTPTNTTDNRFRILAAADLHGRIPQIEKLIALEKETMPDLVVLAGDIVSPFTSPAVPELIQQIKSPKLAVFGNSDPFQKKKLARQAGLRLLSYTPKTVQGHDFIGFSGTIPLPFLSKICLMERRRLGQAGTGDFSKTIVVAHPPPRGIRDKVGGRFHAGSIALRNWIRRYQPDLVICGHIHEASGTGRIGRTKIINCAMNKSCSAAIIDYDTDRNTEVRIIE